MVTKSQYETVARHINSRLSKLDGHGLHPRCSVQNTANHGYGFGKYSLMLNDDLYDLVEYKGIAQDMFYADETYTAGDDDFYLEPVTKTYFDLAVL